MVLVVLLQMLSEVIDPLGQQSNLNVGAPGIAVMHAERFNCFVLLFDTVRFQNNRIPQSKGSPEDVKKALLETGSTPLTPCQGGPQGYFNGDPDSYKEPLLYRKLTSAKSLDDK